MDFSKLFSLEGKVALITGGSRGIGKMLLEGYLAAGCERVYITARKKAQLDETVAEFEAQYPGKVIGLAGDISQMDGVKQLAEELSARETRLDVLVNNAGASWGAPAEDYPLEAWDKVFDLNVRGLFALSQQVAKRSMLPRGSGRIINVASVAGLRGNAGGLLKTAAYNASKGAVVNLTRALAAEWGGRGVTVNAIAPGLFPSKMSQGVIAAVGEEALMGNAPLRRLGGDEDLKGAALLFASDAGQHITGQVLAVDGGYTAV